MLAEEERGMFAWRDAEKSIRKAGLERLGPFVGEWRMQTGFSDAQRAVFEWILDGQFLVERADVSKIPNAKPPNGMAIISFNPETEGYLRHYYDSRGVVRVYKMTFEDGIWTLLRDAPDFTPLDFWQRFTGELSEDGDAIEGTWESSIDGLHWVHDFDLTYTKVRPM